MKNFIDIKSLFGGWTQGKMQNIRVRGAETDEQKEKMCYQSCQKGNQLSCPYPYVTKVMFHDIHPDSDTCQPEVLALFPLHVHLVSYYQWQLENRTGRRGKE